MKPGYRLSASFPGAEPHLRPTMGYLVRMIYRFWKIRPVGALDSDERLVSYANRWYLLTDNGGEINVWEINGATKSVPYLQGTAPVPIGRVAWFCAMTITDTPIGDYGPNDAVDDLTLKEALL